LWEFSSVPDGWTTEPTRNITAGATATIVSLPLSIGLGVIAFAPLGPNYASVGMMAGLHAAAFLGLIALFAGARGIAIYAPRGLVTFSVAAVVGSTIATAPWLPKNDPYMVVSAVFLMLAMVGVFQLLFALARLPRLVKYLPAPVLAGFQNAAAVAIMLSQLPLLLGESATASLSQLRALIANVQLPSVALGVLTIALVFNGHRLSKRVPPILFGLAGGTIAYHVVDKLIAPGALGGTLASIAAAIPDGTEFAGIMAVTQIPGFIEALPDIILAAASVAIVASIDVLMGAKIVENLSRQRGNSTRELLCMGTANSITPLLGGITGSISIAPTATNYHAGGRSTLSLLTHALLMLAVIGFAAPALAYLPKVVIAALVFYSGLQLVDRWTMRLLMRVVRGRSVRWRDIGIDLLIIFSVTGVALSGNMAAAVGLGILVSVVVFTIRMSHGMVRRVRYGNKIHSRRSRPVHEMDLLAQHGQRIMAIELEGPVFFASAEQLHNRIDDAIANGVTHIIVDVERVTELDSTGTQILVQTAERAKALGIHLILSGVMMSARAANAMRDQGVWDAVSSERVLPDLDRALDWCESNLLADIASTTRDGEIALNQLVLLAGMSPDELDAIRPLLQPRQWAAGETVFNQGDDGSELFMILKGSASVRIELGNGDRRLVTFSAGTIFGEMALLDQSTRSATVVADEPMRCYALSRENLEQLKSAAPFAAMKLLENLAREMSHRIRLANNARPNHFDFKMAKSPAFSRLTRDITAFVSAVPAGRVMTLDEIAAAIDVPARHVAYIASQENKKSGLSAPWHRLIKRDGTIAIKSDATRAMLAKEKIRVADDVVIDFKKKQVPVKSLGVSITTPTRPPEHQAGKNNEPPLASLRGLGPTSTGWLVELGIVSTVQLRACDPFDVYLRIKKQRGGASINLLYALIGAIEDRDWRDVAKKDRTAILMRLDDLRQRSTSIGKAKR
jgi:SulP family sulfate permease